MVCVWYATQFASIFTSFKTAVIVNWEEPDYPVTEGDVRSICASVLQSTEREFVVNIVTPTSEGMHYLRLYCTKEGTLCSLCCRFYY